MTSTPAVPVRVSSPAVPQIVHGGPDMTFFIGTLIVVHVCASNVVVRVQVNVGALKEQPDGRVPSARLFGIVAVTVKPGESSGPWLVTLRGIGNSTPDSAVEGARICSSRSAR